jgi:EAL and modified HD-GYP domain-containing signal transduction protein
MATSSVIDHVLIGYAPLTDRQRGPAGMRLTIVPAMGRATPDAAALLQAVGQSFPAPSVVLLNIADEKLLDAVLGQPAIESNIVVEVPAFLAEHPPRADVLRRLRQMGVGLAFSGRPASEIPPLLQNCFRYAITELGPGGAGGASSGAAPRSVTQVVSGVMEMADLERAFAGGASVAIGWPVEPGALPAGKAAVPPDLRGIVDLMNRVDRQEPAEKMEPVLKTDPTLAFRLLRYINSPAFGLRVEVTSFKHALMLLGYGRLKRWLALLLASGSRDQTIRPLMRAAVCRGFLMEELGKNAGDEEIRGEMFVCGVFSLLDQMLRQPFSELLKSVPVPDRVASSLLYPDGPYAAYLDLVRALEQSSPVDIRERAGKLFLTQGDVSRAVLHGLGGARQIE